TAVDVSGKQQVEPPGDGSPLEECSAVQWRAAFQLLEDCRKGRVQDAKTEIGLARLLAAPPMPPQSTRCACQAPPRPLCRRSTPRRFGCGDSSTGFPWDLATPSSTWAATT